MNSRYRSYCLLPSLIFAAFSAYSGELRDRQELSLPISEEKRVVAHYMSNMLYHPGVHPVPTYDSREHFHPDGPSKAIGGFTQTFPIMDFRKTGATIDEAAEFELRAAQELGIGGFQFFYPLSRPAVLDDYNETILAFARAVLRLNADFKLTVCLCSPDRDMPEEQKIKWWGEGIKKLLADPVCRDIWLKTPDGRHILYLWTSDGLSDKTPGIGAVLQNPDLVREDAAAYERLAEYCGMAAAYIYHVRWWMLKHDDVIDALLEVYPAFWSFIPMNLTYGRQWDTFAEKCRRSKRTYTETICPDFYTSKLYRKESDLLYDRVWKLEDALELGVEGMWRRVFVCDLSGELRTSAERAIRTDAPLINITTWNDYPEGHQICPDINHNFAFGLLLKAYKNIWIGRPELNDRDIGMVFYKKYKAKSRPSLADFEVRSEEDLPLKNEDYIEVVTILTAPAHIYLNGENLGTAPAGIHSDRVRSATGPVQLKAVRGKEILFEFTAPEWITDKPYRTDRFTVGYSSEYERMWKILFGDQPPISTCEYAEDQPGKPNWQSGIHLTDERSKRNNE